MSANCSPGLHICGSIYICSIDHCTSPCSLITNMLINNHLEVPQCIIHNTIVHTCTNHNLCVGDSADEAASGHTEADSDLEASSAEEDDNYHHESVTDSDPADDNKPRKLQKTHAKQAASGKAADARKPAIAGSSRAAAKREKAAAQRKEKGENHPQQSVDDDDLQELPPLPATAPAAKKKKAHRRTAPPKTRARLPRGAKADMNYAELNHDNKGVRSDNLSYRL